MFVSNRFYWYQYKWYIIIFISNLIGCWWYFGFCMLFKHITNYKQECYQLECLQTQQENLKNTYDQLITEIQQLTNNIQAIYTTLSSNSVNPIQEIGYLADKSSIQLITIELDNTKQKIFINAQLQGNWNNIITFLQYTRDFGYCYKKLDIQYIPVEDTFSITCVLSIYIGNTKNISLPSISTNLITLRPIFTQKASQKEHVDNSINVAFKPQGTCIQGACMYALIRYNNTVYLVQVGDEVASLGYVTQITPHALTICDYQGILHTVPMPFI